jgi:hypothetical protein
VGPNKDSTKGYNSRAKLSLGRKASAPATTALNVPVGGLASPDPLLAQTLAASTYPLEIIQLQQWLARNKNLKDKALADAVAKETWDPSVQALAALPDVVKRLADDIQWTTDLGNAFLAQQSDVMEAVQRMRKKAQDKGNLKSSEQQKVETKVIENKSVIIVEQANPQVVYVPSYNPTVVYGAPVYAYPPIYYPPPGYYAAGMAISFGVGVAMGAMWSGGWGWNSGWGGNNVQINNFNNFNRNANVNRNVNANRTGNWSHNPQHRGGAPYRDRATANRYGGTARGESLSNRQTGARQQVSRQGGDMPSTRSGSGGLGDRSAGGFSGGNRPSGGGADSIGSRDLSRSSGGGRDVVEPRTPQVAPDHHQPVRVPVRQRAQEHAVYDREDGGVGSNAERKREEHDGGKAGILAERAQRVTHVGGDDFRAQSRSPRPHRIHIVFHGAHRFVVRRAGRAQLVVLVVEMLAELLADVTRPLRHAPLR